MKLTGMVVVVAMTASVGSAHAGWLKDRREKKAAQRGAVTTATSPSAGAPGRQVGPLRSPSASRAPAPAPVQPRHVVLRGTIGTSVRNASRAVGTPLFKQHFDAAVAEINELYDTALAAGDLDGLEAVKDQVAPLTRAYMDQTGKRVDGGHEYIRGLQVDAILRDAGLYRVAYGKQ